MTRRSGGDEGVTAVEFAFVVVIIIFITLGGLDLGLWMFQKSEASQAAREAARVAMIDPASLTLGSSLTNGAVYDAAVGEVESNLPDFSVAVTCADAAGTNIADAASCTVGDLVTVTVTWTRQPLTFFGLTDTVSGSSTRTVVGVP